MGMCRRGMKFVNTNKIACKFAKTIANLFVDQMGFCMSYIWLILFHACFPIQSPQLEKSYQNGMSRKFLKYADFWYLLIGFCHVCFLAIYGASNYLCYTQYPINNNSNDKFFPCNSINYVQCKQMTNGQLGHSHNFAGSPQAFNPCKRKKD